MPIRENEETEALAAALIRQLREQSHEKDVFEILGIIGEDGVTIQPVD